MRFLTLAFFVFLSACTHTIKFIDFAGGTVLHGEYNQLSKNVSVTMPDGEVLSGSYSVYKPGSVQFGQATGNFNTNNAYGSIYANSMTSTVSDSGQAYALLTGPKGTMMEILVSFTGSSGWGRALTNKGKEYKVQF